MMKPYPNRDPNPNPKCMTENEAILLDDFEVNLTIFSQLFCKWPGILKLYSIFIVSSMFISRYKYS